MEDRAAVTARLSAAIREYQREIDALDQAVAERLALNRSDLRCVDLLLDRPMSLTELGERAGLGRSAMTTVLDRLEAAGYARRVRDEGDRRKFLVRLTPKVLGLIGEIFEPYAAEATADLDRYSVTELELLERFFGAGTRRHADHARRIRAQTREPRS